MTRGSFLPKHSVGSPSVANGVEPWRPSNIFIDQCATGSESVDCAEKACDDADEYVGDWGISGTGGGTKGMSPMPPHVGAI